MKVILITFCATHSVIPVNNHSWTIKVEFEKLLSSTSKRYNKIIVYLHFNDAKEITISIVTNKHGSNRWIIFV